jgi:hypothetical protein
MDMDSFGQGFLAFEIVIKGAYAYPGFSYDIRNTSIMITLLYKEAPGDSKNFLFDLAFPCVVSSITSHRGFSK